MTVKQDRFLYDTIREQFPELNEMQVAALAGDMAGVRSQILNQLLGNIAECRSMRDMAPLMRLAIELTQQIDGEKAVSREVVIR